MIYCALCLLVSRLCPVCEATGEFRSVPEPHRHHIERAREQPSPMADFALPVSSTPICNCLGRSAFVQQVAAQPGEVATRRKWPRHGADSATLTRKVKKLKRSRTRPLIHDRYGGSGGPPVLFWAIDKAIAGGRGDGGSLWIGRASWLSSRGPWTRNYWGGTNIWPPKSAS